MDARTLRMILSKAEAATNLDDLRPLVVSLALALLQVNAEMPDRTDGTRGALIAYTSKDRKSTRR